MSLSIFKPLQALILHIHTEMRHSISFCFFCLLLFLLPQVVSTYLWTRSKLDEGSCPAPLEHEPRYNRVVGQLTLESDPDKIRVVVELDKNTNSYTLANSPCCIKLWIVGYPPLGVDKRFSLMNSSVVFCLGRIDQSHRSGVILLDRDEIDFRRD